MKIEIFGPGCHRCGEVEKGVKSVLSELNIVADVEKVKEINKIVDAGIMQTPGLRINGKIKCYGRIPKAEEIKKWISEEK
ncbi:MAG: thioredoxin family protein [Candidatus Omnitrophica bacterium]|nr:thioredoxin family protein [Candidatus Omnitrophota bacterium]